MPFSWREPQVIGGLVTICAIAGAVAYNMLRKRPTPEELERARRDQLVASGRIVDGTVLGINDMEMNDRASDCSLKLILYSYEIGGVEYECSQDVSALGNVIDDCATHVGFPCSVRYQPRNPQNSIVVAENWSGLRDPIRFRGEQD